MQIYLWPAPTRTGLVAGWKIVQTILNLAGFKNVKTKVIKSSGKVRIKFLDMFFGSKLICILLMLGYRVEESIQHG